MKKLLFLILTFCFYLNGVGQVTETKKSEKLLKELSENGCKCIDSIITYNRTTDEISKEIHRCINNQAGAYQLGTKLLNLDLSNLTKNEGEKTINISVSSDEESKEFKEYYYEIERYMMLNCKSIKKQNCIKRS
ncbi:MAG TPA: hypothetical protein P5084_05460 [Paludibacter sp.]|nr:hypothetical protein [Paludibacter sp.]